MTPRSKRSLLMCTVALTVTLTCPGGAALSQTTILRAERMLDVTTGQIRTPAVIVIEADRIQAVNPQSLPADGVTLAVRGNPLDDERVLEQVVFVMKGGTSYSCLVCSAVDHQRFR